MSVRVLVADDQELVRTGLTMILNAQADIEVVGEAVDGREAVALAHKLADLGRLLKCPMIGPSPPAVLIITLARKVS